MSILIAPQLSLGGLDDPPTWELSDESEVFATGQVETGAVVFAYQHTRDDCPAVLWVPFSGTQPPCGCGLPVREARWVLLNGRRYTRIDDVFLHPGDSLRLGLVFE